MLVGRTPNWSSGMSTFKKLQETLCHADKEFWADGDKQVQDFGAGLHQFLPDVCQLWASQHRDGALQHFSQHAAIVASEHAGHARKRMVDQPEDRAHLTWSHCCKRPH